MDIEDRLNAEYRVSMQGGSIILLLKMISIEVSKMEVMREIGREIGEDMGVSKSTIDALDAIGHNLMKDAEKIFGIEYLMNLLTGNGGVEAAGVIKVPPDATFN